MAVVANEPTRRDKIVSMLESLGFDPRKSYRNLNQLEGVVSLIPGLAGMTLSPDSSPSDIGMAGIELLPGGALVMKSPMLHGSMKKGIEKLTKQIEGMGEGATQRGGVYLTDSMDDAKMYATRGTDVGEVYPVSVDTKGMVDASNLDEGIVSMLRGLRGKDSSMLTPTMYQSRQILNFMDNPSKMNFPISFDKRLSDELRKKGVGSILFNMIKNTGGSPLQRAIVLDDDLMKIVQPQLTTDRLRERLDRLKKFIPDE